MLFKTDRTRVLLMHNSHAQMLHYYYTKNLDYFAPWEPFRPHGYHSVRAWKKRLDEFNKEHKRARAFRLVALEPYNNRVVGVCSFTNIVRGVFQSCDMGYSICKDRSGNGLMTEIVGHSVDYVFNQLNLHRIAASYIPDNAASARVLEKCGFEKEGYARDYLKIAGQWRDHILTAKINRRHTS